MDLKLLQLKNKLLSTFKLSNRSINNDTNILILLEILEQVENLKLKKETTESNISTKTKGFARYLNEEANNINLENKNLTSLYIHYPKESNPHYILILDKDVILTSIFIPGTKDFETFLDNNYLTNFISDLDNLNIVKSNSYHKFEETKEGFECLISLTYTSI